MTKHQPLPSTEGLHPRGKEWAEAPTLEALTAFSEAGLEAARAVAEARPALARAIDLVHGQLADGGRLFYVGAGTSGRLGALDAAECPPTFQSDPRQVQVILAGGMRAMHSPIEGAEDDRAAGAQALRFLRPGPQDCVLGISASGGAPFVHGALVLAGQAGARTILLTCADPRAYSETYDHYVWLDTGPELLSGSTRLKAGTATKLALNAISTITMARLGKVWQHRMVDVNTSGNQKLWARGVGLVAEITGLSQPAAESFLERADGSVKLACVMQAGDLDKDAAAQLLAQFHGHLGPALESFQRGG